MMEARMMDVPSGTVISLFTRQAGWRAVIQLVIVIGAAVFGLMASVVFNIVHDALLYGFS
jgi:hypothetical protein